MKITQDNDNINDPAVLDAMPRTIWVVTYDWGVDAKTFTFSSRQKAEKAVADYIMSKSFQYEVDDRMQAVYERGYYNEVREIWNVLSQDLGMDIVFFIDQTTLDADITVPTESPTL